jgi:hypothetical protein
VRIRRPLSFSWRTDSPLLALTPLDEAVTFVTAGPTTGRATVLAQISEEHDTVTAEASVDVVDELPNSSGPRPGIPEPTFVDEPASDWRSRLRGSIWEVNSGHPDFQSAGTSARRKLRYLAALLAKEIVLHSFPMPQLGPALERLVGVLSITERQLDPGGSGKGGPKSRS